MIHAGYTQAVGVDFTGARFFLIGEQGWLAGIGPTRYWQDFGGKRKPGETALQTAAREMKEETGIVADALTTLHTHVTFKNEHVYVIHVARAPGGIAPRPSRELTQSKWMRDFANDFGTETKEAVHRRVLDDEFLTAANAITATSHEAPKPRDEQCTPTPHQHRRQHNTNPHTQASKMQGESTNTRTHRRRRIRTSEVPPQDTAPATAQSRRTWTMWRRPPSGPPTYRGRTPATLAPTQARAPARRRREYFIHPNNHQPNKPRRAYPTRNNSRGPKHATRATAAARHRPQQRDTETAPNSGKHNCNNTNIINNNNNNNDNNNNHNNTAEKTTAKQSPHRRQTQTKSRQHSHDKPRQGSTRASENLDDASSRGSAGL